MPSTQPRVAHITTKQSAAAVESVRITGQKHDADNQTALRKIARACIALAQQQLSQERQRQQRDSTTAPAPEGEARA